MNAIYPLSFVPEARNAFVVGLGGGLSTSIFAEMPAMERVLVSEIAIGAIKALPYFDEQNADFTTQPYYDKAEFVAADAIKVLRSTEERFDIIVSEPNHPWVAGVENLFTVEFLTLVRDRLSDDGVYCQWFPLFVSEPGIVLTILNTFEQVFPHVRAFSNGGGTLSIVASRKPLQVDLEHIEDTLNQLDHRLAPRESDFTDPHFLLATEVLSEWALATVVEDFPATHTFEFPVVSASASRARFAGVGSNMTNDIMDRLHRLPPAQDPEGRMLLEKPGAELQAEDLDRIQQKIARRGEIARLILPRLWYQRSTRFETEPDWPPENQRRLLGYVSGLSNEFPAHLRQQDAAIGASDATADDPISADGNATEPRPASPAAGIVAGRAQAQPETTAPATGAGPIQHLPPTHPRPRSGPAGPGDTRSARKNCDDIHCARLQRAIVHTALQDRDQAEELNELDLNEPENFQCYLFD